jgi:hypothetical protein
VLLNGAAYGSVVAEGTIDVIAATASVGATLMKTGQTVSYRTGDDGDIEAGRLTDFLTLASNNPFGNTNRFTDELGLQTYTNSIIIDWSTYNGSTVLGYCRNGTLGINRNWDASIDFCLALSIGTFTTGWRLWNRNEIQNVMNYSVNEPFNYAPWAGFGIAGFYWTSTTNSATTTAAYNLQTSTKNITSAAKSANSYQIAVRNFTVTGTVLT